MSVHLVVMLVVCLLFVWVQVVFLDGTSRLHLLSCPILSTSTNMSAVNANDTSAICVSSRYFFRWYVVVISARRLLWFFIISAGANASSGDAGSAYTICVSSSCYYKWYLLFASACCPIVSLDDTRSVKWFFLHDSIKFVVSFIFCICVMK